MDKETFEARKAFAGEKKASMLRRCVSTITPIVKST